LLRTFVGASTGAMRQANSSSSSQPFNPQPTPQQTQSLQAENLENLIAENEWKNQLVVWLIPEHIRCKLPRVVQVCWVTVCSCHYQSQGVDDRPPITPFGLAATGCALPRSPAHSPRR
jgi:hypothetical protein